MFSSITPFLRMLVRFLFVPSIFFFGANSLFAATYEITGWGWAADNNEDQSFCDTNPITGLPNCIPGGIGWISFSNKTEFTPRPYGVFIDGATGELSGYAWSSNVGWITFNAFEMQKCTTNRILSNPPSAVTTPDTCRGGPNVSAQIDIVSDPVTGAITAGPSSPPGTALMSGWARACSVFVSGCSGSIRADIQTGEWDGWISLADPTPSARYGMKLDIATMRFLGPSATNAGVLASVPICSNCYAWGGGTTNGFGWGINVGGLKVGLVTSTLPPSLSFWAEKNSIYSGQSATLKWLTSSDITSCTPGLTSPECTITGTDTDWTAFNPQPSVDAITNEVWTSGALTASQCYTLQCTGPNGDTPLRTANVAVLPIQLPEDGVCGSVAPSRNPPTTNLCSSGSASPVTTPGAGNNTWRWNCVGTNGGLTVPCSSSKKSSPVIQYF